MPVVIPADRALFVRHLIAEGRFLTESDVIAEGLRLLCSQESLRTAVRKGFDELDLGKGVAADQVFAKAEQRIASVQRAERA
jgi:putative addiction module CopG family antidote